MIPDLIDHVVGFRQWALGRVVDMRMEEGLWSISQPIRWSRRMRARCLKQRGGHFAPDWGCECGLYAKHNMGYPTGLQSGCGYGAVKAWGKLQVHHDGFRAEYAEVIALAYGDRWSVSSFALVSRVADALGIPLVPLVRLGDLALEHGAPVPRDLRPEWPRIANWAEEAA